MNTKIALLHKKELLKLIEVEGYNRDLIYPKLLERLEICKQVIEDSKIIIPTNYRAWPTRNNIINGLLDLKNLAGIICLYLLDYKDEGTPKYLHRYNYTVEGLQKIFAHLDKEQLKQIDLSTNYKQEYNKLLKKLTENEHPFGLIQLDENWNITGLKCEPVEDIENYIIELDKKIEKKSENLSEEKVKSDKSPDEAKDIPIPKNVPEKPNFFKTYKKSIQTVLTVIFIGLISILVYKNYTKEKLPFEEIKIGNQVWSSEINIAVPDSYCYEDFDKNCESFGRLYSYKSAKKIANKYNGWELPLMKDYNELVTYLGGDDKAMIKLLKGGDSKFNAIMSGYKSDEKIGIDKLNYIGLGSEAAFWTSSIGETKDRKGMNRPYALRIFKSGTWANICDCWTRRDALSLRLIKTKRGSLEDFIKDSIYLKDFDIGKNQYESINQTNKNTIPEPVFKKNKSLSYNILIIPYSLGGFYNTKKEAKKDFGNLIKDRLTQIHNKENNGVFSIKYLPNFENKYIDFSYSDKVKNNFYKSVMRYHNADLIIYETNKIDDKIYSCYYTSNVNIDVSKYDVNKFFETESILSTHYLKGNITSITNWLSSLISYDAGKLYSTKKLFKNAEKYLSKTQNLNIENYKKFLLEAKVSKFLYSDSIIVEKYNKLIQEKPMLSESYIERAMYQNDKLRLEDINNSIAQDTTFILGYYLKFLELKERKENKKTLDILKILKSKVDYTQQYEYIESLSQN